MLIENRDNDVLPQGYELLWYEFVDTIGRGGYGVTYLCVDKNLNRKVAIKEYLPREFACREVDDTVNPLTNGHKELFVWGLERFLVEARTLAKFNHPNIIRVLSIFERNNTAYMVMEYEEGNNLAEVYQNNPNFTEKQLLDIFIPIAEGLALVHQEGFIHRDIKPSNIYIRNDGSSVLLDFGSARQTLGSRTRALTTLVTSGYAPFEQYNQSEDEQGAWTDVYALGATLYYCVTGKKPADALDRGSSLIKSRIDKYEPILQSDKTEYSEQFLGAINHALLFNTNSRPQNAQQWLEMLKGNVKIKCIPDELTTGHEKLDNDTATNNKTLQEESANLGSDKSSKESVDSSVEPAQYTDLNDNTRIRPKGPSYLVEPNNKPTPKAELVGKISNFVKSLRGTCLLTYNTALRWILSHKLVAGVSTAIFTLIMISGIIVVFNNNTDPVNILPSANSQPTQKSAETPPEDPEDLYIKKLLKQASLEMENAQYVTPADNNAVNLLHKILEIEPAHPEALKHLNHIVGHFDLIANKHIADKNFTAALDTINVLSAVSPYDEIVENLQRKLGDSRTNAAQVNQLLKKANLAFNRKRLTKPKSKNALTYYQQVLKLEPGNTDAMSGLDNIVGKLSKVLTKQLKSNQISKAVKTRKKIESIDPNAPILVESGLKINAYYAKRSKINKLLASAKNDFIQGRLVKPKGNNALAKYRKVLRLNRHSKKAHDGVDMIFGYYVSSIYQYIDDSRFQKAKTTLKTLNSIGYGKKQIAALNNIINNKMSESVTETK